MQDHDHAHDHGHAHAHGGQHGHHHHHHGPQTYDRAFAIAAALNMAIVLAQVVFGLLANSMALLSDAVHNFGDVLTLLLGWGAAWLSRRPPSPYRTYGWGRSSVLAALINAGLLLVGVGAIAVEALHRLVAPQPVSELTVMVVAAAGIVINGGTALLFLRGREKDLNLRAQFVHLGGDALVSLGVVIAAFVVHLTGWFWLDPASSLVIAFVIALASWQLLRDSVDLAMDAVPGGVALAEVRKFLAALPGVVEVHDLHIWALSTTDTALTAHLVCEDATDERRRLRDMHHELQHRFGIGHATFQIESHADADLCRLRPQDVV